MNKEKIFKSITDKMYNTFVAKNSDYGNSFEKSLDKRGLIAALMRMEDKLNRLDSLNESKNQKVKDESIEDTLLDLAVYSVLTLVYLIGKREDTVSPECKEFDLENYEPKGELTGFPKEIISRMLDCQQEQGNKRDVSVFEKYKTYVLAAGGFDWDKTVEKEYFWHEVIVKKDFNRFFERYPKEPFSPECKEFDLENYVPIGDLRGFPKEIISRMLDYQVEQGNKRDIRAFEKYITVKYGGFEWSETKEGWKFWNEVIIRRNFDYFFERYPKEPSPTKWQGQPLPPIRPEGVKSLKEIWYTEGILIKPGDVYFYDLSSARFDKPFMTAKVQMVTGPILRGSIICEANWDFSNTYKQIVNGKPEQLIKGVKEVYQDNAGVIEINRRG